MQTSKAVEGKTGKADEQRDDLLVYCTDEAHAETLLASFKNLLPRSGAGNEEPDLPKINNSPPPLKEWDNPFGAGVNFVEGYVDLKTGNKRCVKLWQPKGDSAAKATVVLFHGYGEHSLRYLHVTEHLTENGFRVVGMDHAFHGRDKSFKGYKITQLDNMDVFFEDAAACLQMVSESFPEHPMFVLAHSMGGLISMKACLKLQGEAEKYRLRGIVFSAPAFHVPPIAGAISLYSSFTEGFTGFAQRLAPGMKMNGVTIKNLTREKKVVEANKKDDLCFGDRGSLKFFRNMILETKRSLYKGEGDGAKFKIPFVIFQGSKDKAVSPKGSKKFFENCKIEDKEYVEMKGCFHEVLNEIEPHRSEMMNKMVDWMTKRI